MKTVLIGASSEIAKALTNISDRDFIELSRNDGTFDLAGDLSELDALDGINGLVYFPGTINLKPFNMLKDDDFQNDLEINYLGAVRVLRKLLPKLKEAEGASVVFISTVAALSLIHI